MNIKDLFPAIDDKTLTDILVYTNKETGLSMNILEKDLFITGLITKIFQNEEIAKYLFFKGGTALAKCHHITERFSEDADLFVFSGNPNASRTQEVKYNQLVSNTISDMFPKDHVLDDNGNMLAKRGGDFNQIFISYDSVLDNNRFKPYLQVEITSCSLKNKLNYAVDSRNKQLNSLIGEYLKTTNHAVADKLDLHPISITCVSAEKTLCDKISRLVRISYSEKPLEEAIKYIRDFYDMSMLLRAEQIKDYIASGKIIDDLLYVNKEDILRKNSHAEKDYSKALLFTDPSSIISNTRFQTEYASMVINMTFNPQKAPNLSEIIQTLSSLKEPLEHFDKIRTLTTNDINRHIEYYTKNEVIKPKTPKW